MFRRLGLTEEEIDRKFGFLVDAYKYGAPPHGGAALGLDRLAMLMTGSDNLRDVVAFPKVQNASSFSQNAPHRLTRRRLKSSASQLLHQTKKSNFI